MVFRPWQSHCYVSCNISTQFCFQSWSSKSIIDQDCYSSFSGSTIILFHLSGFWEEACVTCWCCFIMCWLEIVKHTGLNNHCHIHTVINTNLQSLLTMSLPWTQSSKKSWMSDCCAFSSTGSSCELSVALHLLWSKLRFDVFTDVVNGGSTFTKGS